MQPLLSKSVGCASEVTQSAVGFAYQHLKVCIGPSGLHKPNMAPNAFNTSNEEVEAGRLKAQVCPWHHSELQATRHPVSLTKTNAKCDE